jgi:hemerythrin-like domain-containing protein
MHPEDDLRADHMAMRRGVKMLDQLTSVLREGHGVRNTDLFTLVDVLDETAAEHHYAREEQVLFGYLRERQARFGFDGLRQFHEDHDDLDDRLADIRELVEPAAEGDQRARQNLEKAVDRYADALREHLQAEERTFLDRLHENLSTDEIRDLGDQLTGADDAPKARARLEERLQRLEERYEDRLRT